MNVRNETDQSHSKPDLFPKNDTILVDTDSFTEAKNNGSEDEDSEKQSSTIRVRFKDKNLEVLRHSQFGFAQSNKSNVLDDWFSQGRTNIPAASGNGYQYPKEFDLVPETIGQIKNVAGVSYYSNPNKEYDFYLGNDLSRDEKTLLRCRIYALNKIEKNEKVSLEIETVFRNGVLMKRSKKETGLTSSAFLSLAALNILTPFLRCQIERGIRFNLYDCLQKYHYPSPELFTTESNQHTEVYKPFRFLPEYSPIKEAIKKNKTCLPIKKKKKKKTFLDDKDAKDAKSFGGVLREFKEELKEELTKESKDKMKSNTQEDVPKDILSSKETILKFYDSVENLLKKKTLGTPGRPSASNKAHKGTKRKMETPSNNYKSQLDDPNLYFQMTAWNMMVTALTKCPIPVEAAAISIYGFNECIPLLKESLCAIKGILIPTAQRITLPKQDFCIFSHAEFRAKLEEATTSLVAQAAELPWEELYCSYMHFNDATALAKLDVDVNFYTYIHQVLLGDAFEVEKDSTTVGPIKRDAIHLLAKGTPKKKQKIHHDG